MKAYKYQIVKRGVIMQSGGVARARCTGLGSALAKLEVILFYFLGSIHDLWLAEGTFKNIN